MSEPAPKAKGYTPRLAIHHLAIGLSRPRAVTREALAAGIGEQGRLLLPGACLGLIIVSDADMRESVTSYATQVLQAPELWLKIAGLLLFISTLSTILLTVSTAGPVCPHAILRLFGRGRRFFANTRSAFSLACWIAIIPSAVLSYIDSYFDSPTLLDLEQIDLFRSLIALIFLTYFTFCLSGATTMPLAVSAAAALGGFLGSHVALEDLAAGLEQFAALVRDAQ